jgi:MFS family permease
LQFIASPLIGSLSDRIGRRKTLLLSMVGNVVSVGLWIFSTNFPLFILSRVIGGLTEGNVQISIAMLSDISSKENRSKALALVGMCFAFGFTFGPPLGAALTKIGGYYDFFGPALFSFLLISIECFLLWNYLPETLDLSVESKKSEDAGKQVKNRANLTVLSLFHFVYLFVFSGMEFTLTFLTFERFNYSNTQQGRLLGFMGIVTAIIQGFYVRRQSGKELKMVIQGLLTCTIGLTILSLFHTEDALYYGIFFLAITSGTVITCLTALASFEVSENDSGTVLGWFRSSGQLGRAMGPIVCCTGYWIFGSMTMYLIGATIMFLITALFFTLSRFIQLKIKQD